MITDVQPRKVNRASFLESEQIKTLDLPQDGRLLAIAKSLESPMKDGRSVDVRRSRTQASPAPAAQFEIGCSSSFHGRPGLGSGKLRM
jgi:hypothetical protein